MRNPLVIGAVLSLLAPVSFSETARAQSPSGSTTAGSVDAADEVVSKVTKSSDPKAAYQALNSKDQAAFNARLKSATFTVESQTSEKDESVAGKACWKGQARGSGKNAIGKTIYTYWVEGSWCASGNRVTSSAFTRADGETKTPGWRYDAVKSKDHEIANNIARVWAKQRFILGIGGWDIQTVDVCLRFSGEANGKITAQSTCGPF
jgi:hypothetical protein